jgi:hypothetical protein
MKKTLLRLSLLPILIIAACMGCNQIPFKPTEDNMVVKRNNAIKIDRNSEVDLDAINADNKFEPVLLNIENNAADSPLKLIGIPQVKISSSDFSVNQSALAQSINPGNSGTFLLSYISTVNDGLPKNANITIPNDFGKDYNFTVKCTAPTPIPTEVPTQVPTIEPTPEITTEITPVATDVPTIPPTYIKVMEFKTPGESFWVPATDMAGDTIGTITIEIVGGGKGGDGGAKGCLNPDTPGMGGSAGVYIKQSIPINKNYIYKIVVGSGGNGGSGGVFGTYCSGPAPEAGIGGGRSAFEISGGGAVIEAGGGNGNTNSIKGGVSGCPNGYGDGGDGSDGSEGCGKNCNGGNSGNGGYVRITYTSYVQ